MLPTPNIDLGRIPECQKYLAEGSHRRLYRFSPDDYQEMAGIWSQLRGGASRRSARRARSGRRHPEGGQVRPGGRRPVPSRPDYAPEEMFEIAAKLYKKSR